MRNRFKVGDQILSLCPVPRQYSVRPKINRLHTFPVEQWLLPRGWQSVQNLLRENLALRQHLTFLERRHPKPQIGTLDQNRAAI
jgi:hypothetical protein